MKNNINDLIVNSIYNNIKYNYKSLYNTYQFKTKNQKYKLKFILKACVHFISISCSYKNFMYFNLNHNTFYKNIINNKIKIYKIKEDNKLNIIYNAPYQSKYNPIEYIFSLLRKQIQQKLNKTYNELINIINTFIKNIEESKLKNIFNHVIKLFNQC